MMPGGSNPVNRLHLPSLAQFGLSGLGLLSLLTITLLLAAGALAYAVSNLSSRSVVDNPFYALTWIAGFFTLLTIPSVVFSLCRLIGKDLSGFEARLLRLGLRAATIALLIWPFLLLAGHFITQNRGLAGFLLPPIQVLCVAIPLWWLVEIARRNLEGISLQRMWGVLNFSFLVSTGVILVIEILLLFAAGLTVGLILASQPGSSAELERILQRLAMAQTNPEVALRIIRPYLQQPLVLVLLLAGAAGVVPLLEEMFKPLGLWFLAGKNLTPAAGFSLGAASGLGFALLESLSVLLNTNSDGWAVLALGRMGTGLLHLTASGLVGWGLASAWSEGKIFRLGLGYGLAVLLHGIWNFFGLLMGISALLQPAPSAIQVFVRAGQVGPAALAVLAAALFGILLVGNRLFKQQPVKNMVNSTPAGSSSENLEKNQN